MAAINDAKLALLRARLVEAGLDALVVGSGDAHSSEYVAERDTRRAFISEFTGSAGTALITRDKALCWTDGRYFLQASLELSPAWTLMRSGDPGVPELNDWLLANMPDNSVVGVDGFLMTESQAGGICNVLKAKGISLKPTEDPNPVDYVWNTLGKQPAPPCAAVTVNSVHAGQSHTDKIAVVQKKLRATTTAAGQSPTCFVVSMLDEIVWLFNIRGADVSYNPVVMAYAVVTLTEAHLFVDETKISEAVRQHLGPDVVLHPYDAIEEFLRTTAATPGSIVGVDPLQLNWRLCRAVGTSIHRMTSPLTLAKAIKNDRELDGIRSAHIRDGAALTAFLHWLETTVKAAPLSITEYDVAVKIEEFRKKAGQHVSPSFDTIAGYGSNGAIIHYKPEAKTAAAIGVESLFLLDSGAQYLDGTTDVTRTLHFGTPTQRMIDCYTMVLKGHIALARAIFPETTLGSRLDSLARTALWAAGLDYNHGTGHGVGAFLNVHEGPHGIGFRKRDNEVVSFLLSAPCNLSFQPPPLSPRTLLSSHPPTHPLLSIAFDRASTSE